MPNCTRLGLRHAGQDFTVELDRRQLDFGQVGKGAYYWMNSSQFRRGGGGPNFRPCVDLWWSSAEEAGEAALTENRILRVLAECYPLVSTARGMQRVFLDAHLSQGAARDRPYGNLAHGRRAGRAELTFTLPEDDAERLQGIASQRNASLVANEVQRLLAGSSLSELEKTAYDDQLDEWSRRGIEAFDRRGQEGLERFKRELAEEMASMRKRGGPMNAAICNHFAYECKAAFYTCYTSAWIAIRFQLVDQGEIDELGEHLIRLWHFQQQPPESPDGDWVDAFCGNVLALHPLSGFMLMSPSHLERIGRWIGHSNYAYFSDNRRLGECEEYWDLVGAVLIAAHEYVCVRSQWEERRTGRVATGAIDADSQGIDEQPDAAAALDAFAADNGICCDRCGKAVKFVGREDQASSADAALVDFACPSCGERRRASIDRAEFQSWMSS